MQIWVDDVFFYADTEDELWDTIDGLSDMRRPEATAELMKFLQAMNWLRTSLPRMAEVVAPLRLFLEELMTGAARRTKRVAKTALFLPPRGRRVG